MNIQPYLFFDGRCQEALDFYKVALGAKVEMLMHFKDSPMPPNPEQCVGGMPQPDKVMHACMKIGDTAIMLSDGQCLGKPSFQGFALSVSATDDAHAAKLFSAVSEGGKIQMPLAETFFASSFGMAEDRFGVSWMVIAEKK